MTMNRSVYRHAIPADDTWHTVALTGPVLHVDCRQFDAVELWTLHNEGEPPTERTFRVFGTGHALPEDSAKHVGTALSPGTPFSSRGSLVWHLFEQSNRGAQ